MVSFRDVPAQRLIHDLAGELEKNDNVKAPSWASFVKTGVHKERPPTQDNWWHLRAASVLRRVAKLGPIGTGALRRHYGGRKNRGHAPDRYRLASGNIIRTVLQQLEAAGLVEQAQKGVHKGRVVTSEGHKLLNSFANKIIKDDDISQVAIKELRVKKSKKKSKKKSSKKKSESKDKKSGSKDKKDDKKSESKESEKKSEDEK